MTINIRIGTSMVLCTRFEHQGFGGGGVRWTNGLRVGDNNGLLVKALRH